MADSKKLIKTSIGFNCRIDEDIFDDAEIFELVRKVEKGDMSEKLNASMDLLVAILGEEQKDKLFAHLKKTEGKAKISRATDVLAEIIDKLGESKKK